MAFTQLLTATVADQGYVRHPASGAATSKATTDDGAPVDAGTWQLLVNNAQVLHRESARHLVSAVLGGDVGYVNGGGWDDLAEDVPPSAQRNTTTQAHAWLTLGSSATARLYGPFPQLNDAFDDATRTSPLPRRVTVEIQCYGHADFRVDVALTHDVTPPSDGIPLAFGSFHTSGTSTGTSPETLTFTLQPTPAAGVARIAGRPTDLNSGAATVPEYWIWVGWVHPNTGTNGLLSASAWEVWEDNV